MKNETKKILDLYTDYLITSFSQTSATNLSRMLDNKISHDKISRFLRNEEFTQKDYWYQVKEIVRKIESEIGIISIDDTIEEKPYTDENEIISWYFDHSKGKTIKGVNILSFLYNLPQIDINIPVSFEIIEKTEKYIDKKTGKEKKKSIKTKNEITRERLYTLTKINKIMYKYVLFDSWFSSKENIKYIYHKLGKDVICAIKSNRYVALTKKDKFEGNFKKVSELNINKDSVLEVYIKGMEIPVLLTKQVFKNENNTIGKLYVISSDTKMNYEDITTIYKKRWKIEEYHKSIKQNTSLEKSPTKIVRTQSNHIFTSILAYIKLEKMKIATKLNHFAMKNYLYIKAIKNSYLELKKIKKLITI